MPTVIKPLDIYMHVDIVTFERTKFITIVDRFLKYAQAFPLNSLSGTDKANNLTYYFCHHEIPLKLQ